MTSKLSSMGLPDPGKPAAYHKLMELAVGGPVAMTVRHRACPEGQDCRRQETLAGFGGRHFFRVLELVEMPLLTDAS